MELNGVAISPGQEALVKITVGQLPSGNRININAFVQRGQEDGPTMLVLAGVHGDEINGVETIRRAVSNGFFNGLQRGNVIAIPVLNIFGFINFSRDVHDGKDVNRSFPGEVSGSLASRVAHVLTRKVLPLVDFGIDFHTGGRNLYNFPQIRYSKGHEESEALAKAFAAPFTIGSKPIAKSLRRAALDLGKPMLVFEGGESLRLDGFSIQRGLEGLQRVLVAKGMTDGILRDIPSLHFQQTGWLRAPKSGMFVWSRSSGAKISKGEPLGTIGDPYGQEVVTIFAKRDAYVIGHNNTPVVNQGDALFHLAY